MPVGGPKVVIQASAKKLVDRAEEEHTIELARKIVEAHNLVRIAAVLRANAHKALSQAQESLDLAEQDAAIARKQLIDWLS